MQVAILSMSFFCGFFFAFSVASAHEPYKGTADICHVGNVWVALDQDLNIRTMRFGQQGSHLVQTMVHCQGKPSDSCVKTDKHSPFSFLQKRLAGMVGSSCDFGSCPCKFDMPHLPPLYVEYQKMAQYVFDAESSESGKVFLIGLGGGMFPQYIVGNSQNLSVDVAEINGDVVEAARSFFGLAAAEATGRLKVTTSDGFAALSKVPPGSYERVVVDCADGAHVPAPCRSIALITAIHAALRPHGVAVQNVPVGGGHDDDLEPLLELYREAFGTDSVFVSLKEHNTGNVVIRALM